MQVLDKAMLGKCLEETILADVKEGKVGGVAVAVMQNGDTVYQNCFGNEQLGIHVTENTMFRLASMTKPITTAAILLLIDKGLIDLDMQVSRFIPGFEQMYIGEVCGDEVRNITPAKTSITIRHLLSHSSGLGSGPVGVAVSNKFPAAERVSLEKVVEYYSRNPLDFEPYTKQFYSAIHGFDVLARIVEIVAGMPFDEFLRKEIFMPLGMTDTTFAPTDEQWKRMIPMHNYAEAEGQGKIAVFSDNTVFGNIPTSCCCGGAGLASTLIDYKKFASMLLNKGRVQGKQLISEELICQMSTPQVPKSIMNGHVIWGLGVRIVVSEYYKDLPIGSYGWSGAYGSHFWVDPTNNITAIYLKNSLYDGGSGAKTARRFEQVVNQSLIQ